MQLKSRTRAAPLGVGLLGWRRAPNRQCLGRWRMPRGACAIEGDCADLEGDRAAIPMT